MSATSNPFGARPAYHPSGLDRPRQYTITSGYGTNIYKGQAVLLSATGVITVAAATGDFLGFFAGVQFTDNVTGRPTQSDYWPSGENATNIQAWVWDDPLTVYEIQANGSIPATAVGNQANLDAGSYLTGSAVTGISTGMLSSTLAGVGVQAQMRIVGFGQQIDNLPGDAFTIVQAVIAQHQYVANKVAI